MPDREQQEQEKVTKQQTVTREREKTDKLEQGKDPDEQPKPEE